MHGEERQLRHTVRASSKIAPRLISARRDAGRARPVDSAKRTRGREIASRRRNEHEYAADEALPRGSLPMRGLGDLREVSELPSRLPHLPLRR